MQDFEGYNKITSCNLLETHLPERFIPSEKLCLPK